MRYKALTSSILEHSSSNSIQQTIRALRANLSHSQQPSPANKSHLKSLSSNTQPQTQRMASLIIGAGILGYVTMKDRKAKKAEKSRQAEEAREAEFQMQQRRLADEYYGTNNDTRNQSEQFVAPPAYSEKLRRRSSSIYSQGSDTEAQRNQGGNA